MNDVGLATQYIGYLDQTDTLTEIVDELEFVGKKQNWSVIQ